MGQPTVPPPRAPPLQAPGPHLPGGAIKAGACQVRCAGCRLILNVAPGVTEFVCPTCKLPQMLPPELTRTFQLPTNPNPNPIPAPNPASNPNPPVQAHGIDPTKIQLPCANCKAILNVPHGLAHFKCPQCGVDLAVDLSKLKQFLPQMPPQLEEVNEVAIEVEREEDEGGLVGDTFTDYRPPKLSIGPPHPDPVVETSSLSAVQPPEPTYDLLLKDDLENMDVLSCLQIETLVYACQRHMHHLDDGNRAGFFIGDGAGVGKGRTIAGLVWENWQCGRKKALWISVGSDLKFDARRDLDDVGASCIEVHALNKLPYSKLDSKSVGVREGVVFLTYSSLIASSEKGRSRLQQLVQWCGSEFDGLVIYDECHKAKNLVPEAGSQPTKTGEVVLELQAKLPEARVIYCSATGASEPRNMGYMVRLGLWGPGTSFSDFREFLAALDKGGVGALELVAMDMKARGMFVCRTLSYRGAEFEIIEAPLDDKMSEMYRRAAEFWAELRVELLSALTFITGEKPAANQLWRFYWASHQRFFRHICISAKVPAVVKLAKKALLDNKCVVVGLQSTGEARTEDAVAKYGNELDDFVSGPRELLLKFVEENYPFPEMPEPLPGENGEETVQELSLKRRSADSDISVRGRVRKVAKWRGVSDNDSDDNFEPDESDHESTESDDDDDDEFQICDICSGEEDRKKLLRCICCGQHFHPSCLDPPEHDPPVTDDLVSEEWTCISCKQKTAEYIQAKRAYIEEVTKRYNDAVERKAKILDIVRSLDLPNNPLDDLIDQLGGPEEVAEITGRKGMLVRAAGGKGVTYQARNTKDVAMEMVNMHEKQLFMDGKKLVAIISEAGSAGVSLHADRRAINQRRRVHITLELPWSADRAIQQFGRTHRSNQASAPEYRLLFTNMGGERRFASIVAKRLESLGALTQGDRRAGPSLSAFNYDSSHGKRALYIMYRGVMEQDSLPVTPPGCSPENQIAIQEFIHEAKAALVSVGIIRDSVLGTGKDTGKLSGRIVDSDMHDVARFLNRLLGLPPDIQNRLFELFTSILDFILQKARTEGNWDSGIVDIKANKVELQANPKVVHVDHMSGASTILFTLILDRGVAWEYASTLLKERQSGALGSANDGFYESRREWLGRRHILFAYESSETGLFKIVRPAIGEAIREMSTAELKSKYRKISSPEKVRTSWQEEYEVSSKQCMHGAKCKLGNYCTVGRRIQELNVLGGLILPVWKTVEKALSKQDRITHRRIRVVRVETTADTQRIVGLLVPNAAVEDVFQGLTCVQEVED